MSDATITFAVLGGAVVLFISNRVPVAIVAIGAALSLWATGVVDLSQALAGFGDPTVIFIATLFVISEGLDASGVTTLAGQELIARAGGSRTRLLVLMMVLVGVVTALISVNGAVAALLPVVVLMAIRNGPPSQLLLPLVFAAHAGSLLTLTGTPVNVLISGVAETASGRGFGFFEFALVGVPLLLGTMAIVIWFGQRLLPYRTARVISADLSAHARTLMEQYTLTEGPFRLTVQARSPYVGLSPTALDLHRYPGVALLGAQTLGAGHVTESQVLSTGDVLVMSGDGDTIRRLAGDNQLTLRWEPPDESGGALFTKERGAAEFVIPPRSELIGELVFPGMASSNGDLVILAVQRGSTEIATETMLRAGDMLLLQGGWEALGQKVERPDLLVVDAPDLVRRRAAPLGRRAKTAIAVLIGMVALLATGALPEAITGLLATCALILARVISLEQAYRAISWTTVILVAAMIPLATAMRESGAAEMMAGTLVDVVGESGPYALLLGLFLLTAGLGQLISNMATALVVSPIAVSAAVGLGVSPRPLLMTVAVAAAASFLTPVATPVNLMVKEPGGYYFQDYWKLGLPLLLWFLCVSLALVPLFWPF